MWQFLGKSLWISVENAFSLCHGDLRLNKGNSTKTAFASRLPLPGSLPESNRPGPDPGIASEQLAITYAPK
jgi:hypothetical protein